MKKNLVIENKDHTHGNPCRILDRPSQDQQLESKQNCSNGQNIAQHGQQGISKTHETVHQYNIPKPMTNIMGVSDAKAMSPKPSINGSRP